MNAYEINIVLQTKEDAVTLLKKYEFYEKDEGAYLESLIPKLFDTAVLSESKNIFLI